MKRAFLLIALALLLAGCTEPGDLPGDDPAPAYTNGVQVSGPTCTVEGAPCATQSLTQYSIPKLTVTATNDGETPVTVQLSGFPRQGRNVLTTLCDTYRVREFTAEKETAAATRTVTDQRSVTLAPGERVALSWFLEVARDVDLSNTSILCATRFSMNLSQTVTAVQQVQIRESSDIEQVTGLDAYTSTDTPVQPVVDVKPSIVQQEIGGELAPVVVKSYVLNHADGEIVSLSHPQGVNGIHVSMSGVTDRECSETSAQVTRRTGTDQFGREQTTTETLPAVVCRFVPDPVTGSQVYDVTAETMYRYNLPLPAAQLRLAPLEVQR